MLIKQKNFMEHNALWRKINTDLLSQTSTVTHSLINFYLIKNSEISEIKVIKHTLYKLF